MLSDAAKHDATKSSYTLSEGFNLLADLDIQGSKGMGTLMASGGVTEKVIPIVGTISRSTFSKTAAKADKLKNLNLSVALPDLKVPGLPSTITITKPVFAVTELAPKALKQPKGTKTKLAGPFVTIGADLKMQAGSATHEFDSLLMTGKDAKGKRVIDLVGSAKDPKGLFTFKGLTVKTLDLASVYEAQTWDFRLDGTAALNSAAVSFDTEIKKDKGKVTYVATLSGGKSGITAEDVVGRPVPGFDKVVLDKVVVTNDRLVADLEFGAKKTPGEIAAFHPGKLEKAVMAVTLDKLAFGDLVPGAVGSALDGVNIDDLTLVVVPPKGGGLKPDDKAIPAHISANLKKVLSDAGLAKGYALKPGFNMFSQLDLEGSGGMTELMEFIGYDPKKGIPITGVMSNNMFSTKVKGLDRFKGMDIGVPVPKISLAKLPGAFTFDKSQFKITDADPSGKAGVWVGLIADLNGDLMGDKIAFKSDIGFGNGKLALTASSPMELPAPFGISWLELKDLNLKLDYDKKTRSGDFVFTAVPTKPFGKVEPKISIDLHEVNGKLKAGVLKIQEKVAFSDLPILKGIAHADKFDFTYLEISKSGVSGGSQLHGQEVDAVVFEQSGKWVFAVSDDGGGNGFKFSRLVPALSHTPLADFHLNDAALIFSQIRLSEKVNKLPEVAQTVFGEIYGGKEGLVVAGSGISIAANFSPGNSSGSSKKGLKGIGLHEDVLIEGSLENIFGGKGAPAIDVLVQIEQGPGGKKGASHVPKMAKFPGEVGFFIQYKEEEFDVGLSADVILHMPKKQQLLLTTKLELEIELKEEDGFAVDIFMDLSGNWDEPFGIPGIDLEDVAIKFGIDMEGKAKFGMAGKVELADGQDRVNVAGEMEFLVEAELMPDAIAIRGDIEEMGIPALIDIAERMAGGKGSLPSPEDIPLPEYRNVVFAYATPGFTDPQLDLVDSGFKLAGDVYFMGHELGKAAINAGPTGVKMDASVDPIDLEVLKLKKNQMKFDLEFKQLPNLEIESQIEFLGAEEDVVVKFDNGMANIELDTKIGGGIWDSTINLGFEVDAATKAAGAKKGAPDIFVEGVVKADFFTWLTKEAPQKVQSMFNALNADFEKAKAKINSAQAKVDGLNRKINARKEVIQRERASADRALQNAQNHARSLLDNANSVKRDAEGQDGSCHWYSPWHCGEAAYYWARYGIEWAAYKVAEGVLDAAKETVDHLPSELMDPELAGLEAAHLTATGALDLAKLAIDGVEDADKWMASGLASLVAKIGESDALVVKEIFFEGDMAAMAKGQPFILSMDLEVFGDDLGTQMFAFKLTDPVFDAEQLAFIPLHMVSELFEKYLPSSLKNLAGPILTAINKESRAAEKKVHDELKNIPGLKLPPEIEKALEAASLEETEPQTKSFASLNGGIVSGFYEQKSQRTLGLGRREILVASNTNVMNDSGESLMMLAQATTASEPKGETAPKGTSAMGQKAVPSKGKPSDKTNQKKQSFSERFEAYKEKRRNLLPHIVNRNRPFGEAMKDFQKKKMAERAKTENDRFVAFTDIHVPPGVLFNERLLVARHSKLCLGQNVKGDITFHPCNENTGGLLWSTKRKLVNHSGHLVPWNDAFATKFPSRVYTQLVHNGACLTTPFHLASYDAKSKREHAQKLTQVARGGPEKRGAHLKLSACRSDGRGQLWKVVKQTHSNVEKSHGFKLQERNSAFCLRPDSVKAHTKKNNKEVNAVFFPCTGIAHGTFELTVPNSDMPIWYDHNGVIKSDNGFCLDVPNEPAANADKTGSIVYMKKCTDDQYDRWDYVVEYDKSVKILNDFTGHCLYPYDKREGAIPAAQHGQLVQRPCDGRYGQGWKMRVLPQQKWFQLEAVDSSKKATGKCMMPNKPNPGQDRVNVFVKSCAPATRGRWQFGHWKGTYLWTEWTRDTQSELSSVYWVSKDDLSKKVKRYNGVCRVLIGSHDGPGSYDVYPGTWYGKAGLCTYMLNGELKQFSPSRSTNTNYILEVLSGLDIGVPGATGSWRNSEGGVPFDTRGQNLTPPNPLFSPFLVGGGSTQSAFYLCRVKRANDQGWEYGYQSKTHRCVTEPGQKVSGGSEVLVFRTVNNAGTRH